MGRQLTTGPDIGLPDIGPLIGTSGGTVVTVPPGYSNAAGTWTEMIASTTGESAWVYLWTTSGSAAATALDQFAEVGIGAAASEVAIATFPFSGLCQYFLPLRFPTGTRVSVRVSSANATLPTTTLWLARVYGPRRGDNRLSPTSLDALGVVATNQGTNVNAANTWTQLTASTTEPYRGLIWTGSCNDTNYSGSLDTVDLGIGASGSETLVSSVVAQTGSSESISVVTYPTLVRIPTGTRVSARNSNGTNDVMRVVALAVPYT